MSASDLPHDGDVMAEARADSPPMGLEMLAPLLCLIGLCIAAYLAILHYSVMLGDLSLGGACGGGTWGDCNSVIASRYGKLLGLPVSIWGMWFYICAGTISLAILFLRRPDAAGFVRALFWLTVAALAFDAYLGWTMWRRLERFCPFCAVTYGVNVLILLIALRCRRRLNDNPAGARSLVPSVRVLLRPGATVYYREVFKTFLLGLWAGSSLLILIIAVLVNRSIVQNERDNLASLLEYVRKTPPFYIPTEGQPSRGSDDSPVTIVVFSDFLCEQCKLARSYFDIVSANHRDSLRMVYVNYPADTTCNAHVKTTQHSGACRLAAAGECARRQGRFWQFHDVVLDDPGKVKPERVEEYATRSGLELTKFNACMAEAATMESVRSDIALAHSVHVEATPTSFVNGRPVVGALKPWMLEAVIEAVMPLPLPTPSTTTVAPRPRPVEKDTPAESS